jgi:hypothetical protein
MSCRRPALGPCPTSLTRDGSSHHATGVCERQAAGEEGEKAMRGKVPRIFYATRTHSQIAQVRVSLHRVPLPLSLSYLVLNVLCGVHALRGQVVRELKRTAYRPAMVILVRAIFPSRPSAVCAARCRRFS